MDDLPTLLLKLFIMIMVAWGAIRIFQALRRPDSEGARRFRFLLKWTLLIGGIVLLFMTNTFADAAFLILAVGAVTWVYRGFKKS